MTTSVLVRSSSPLLQSWECLTGSIISLRPQQLCSEIHHCVDAKTTFPGAASQRLSSAGTIRKQGTPLMANFGFPLAYWNLSRFHGSLVHFYPPFLSSLFTWSQTCITVWQLSYLLLAPSPFFLTHGSTNKILLGINLPKETKDPYAENYKTLIKKLKMIQTDREIYHVLGLEESTLWKWLYYLKQSTDSM